MPIDLSGRITQSVKTVFGLAEILFLLKVIHVPMIKCCFPKLSYAYQSDTVWVIYLYPMLKAPLITDLLNFA